MKLTGRVTLVSDEAWQSLTAHLLDEPFYTRRAALRPMKRQGHGKIINCDQVIPFAGGWI